MSSDLDSPHVVHFVNAGTYDVFRKYLDSFGPSLDLNDLENSIKTPGYIVSGEVVEHFPPVTLSSGFYNCVFIIRPVSFAEQCRVVVQTLSPKYLKQISKNSFVALYNPKYFLGVNGTKSFSLGPEQFVLWFSRAPLKLSKKRPASSPIKLGASTHKHLKLSPQQNHGDPSCSNSVAALIPSSEAGRNADRLMPPPSRWIDCSRRRTQHQSAIVPLDSSAEISCRSSRAGCHSVCSHSRHSHCARTHSTCAPVQQSSCCRVPQQNCCCDRQCCSHNRASHGCQPGRTCRCDPPPSCSTRPQFGNCRSGCGYRSCNDSREADHRSTCCSKHHSHEANSRAYNGLSGSCQRPGTSRSPNKPLDPAVSGRQVAGSSHSEHSGWFVQNWVEQSTRENARGAQGPIIEPQDTQATCGDSFHKHLDDDDAWSSVSGQHRNPKTNRMLQRDDQNLLQSGSSQPSDSGDSAPLVQPEVPSIRERVKHPGLVLSDDKAQKKTKNSRAIGIASTSRQDSAKHTPSKAVNSQGKSTRAGACKQTCLTLATQKDTTSKSFTDQSQRRQNITSEQVFGDKSSKGNHGPTHSTTSHTLNPQAKAGANQKSTISLSTAHQKSGRMQVVAQDHTKSPAYDRSESLAQCSKDMTQNDSSHQGIPSQVCNLSKVTNPPKPRHIQHHPGVPAPKAASLLESGSSSDDSDTSTLFFGKTQSLLLGGPKNANKNFKAPETQNQDLNRAIHLSSSDEDDLMEVDHDEKQPEQQERISPEIAMPDSQLTCRDTLEPPPMKNSQMISMQQDAANLASPDAVRKNGGKVIRKKGLRLRKLFNPANNSLYYDPQNPAESARCENLPNESAEVCSEAVDVTTDTQKTGVAKPTDGATMKDNGESQKLASDDEKAADPPPDCSSEPVVESMSQDTDDEIIPPSDAEIRERHAMILSSDVEMPHNVNQEPPSNAAEETLNEIQTFVEEWDSDPPSCNIPEQGLIPRSTSALLFDLLSEKGSPSKELGRSEHLKENISNRLNEFMALHTESNVGEITQNRDVADTNEAADHTDHPDNQGSHEEEEHRVVEKTVVPVASSQQKVVSDSGSEVTSGQSLHDWILEKLYLENLMTSEYAHYSVSRSDMMQTLCENPSAVDDSSRKSHMSLTLCDPDHTNDGENSVPRTTESQSSASLEPPDSDVGPNQDQEGCDMSENRGVLLNPTRFPRTEGGPKSDGSGVSQVAGSVKDPIEHKNTTDGTCLGPARTSSDEPVTVSHKPPKPTSDPPASQSLDPARLSSHESVASSHEPPKPTSDPPTSQVLCPAGRHESVASSHEPPKPSDPPTSQSLDPARTSSDEPVTISHKPPKPTSDPPTSHQSLDPARTSSDEPVTISHKPPKPTSDPPASPAGSHESVASSHEPPKPTSDPPTSQVLCPAGRHESVASSHEPPKPSDPPTSQSLDPARTSSDEPVTISHKPPKPTSDPPTSQSLDPARMSSHESVASSHKPPKPTSDPPASPAGSHESVASSHEPPKPSDPPTSQSLDPARMSSHESVASSHKPPKPTSDPPASPAGSHESVASSHEPPKPTSDPPTSQASSDINLRITDSGSLQSHDVDKPSNVTDDVTKIDAVASRCSPDSTGEQLSEEYLLNFDPPCSPASTIFYDAEALEDEEVPKKEEECRISIQGRLKEIAKTFPSSAKNADVSHRLTLPGQVFGVHVTIVDMKPLITPETRTDIVKGVCETGCGAKFQYDKVTREKTILIRPCSRCSLRRHHLCPTCMETGERRPLCLQFFFEIHTLIGSHKCLRLQVELEDAVEFLGIGVKQYLQQDAASLETVRALQNLSDSRPEESKRRLQGQIYIRTADRGGEIVPFLTGTQLSDLRLSKNLM